MATPTSDTQATRTGYVDVPGGRLYYEETGQGQSLLFIHADVANLRMWDEQVAAFADRYRVVRYDKRGFGKTTAQDGPYSPRADVLALLDHLNIEQASVVGLSNGAALALDFTLEHPERVAALVTVSGGVSGYEDAPMDPAEMPYFEQWQQLQERGDSAGLLDLGVYFWCDGPNQPEGRSSQHVRDRIRAMMSENDANHHEKLEPTPLEPPAFARLATISVPTLSVQGTFDESTTRAAMDLVAARVPGARRATFETAHMVNMEQPEAFNALLAEFLATAASGSAMNAIGTGTIGNHQPTSKAQLLADLNAEQEQWEALLRDIGEAHMTQPGVAGVWSVKDVVSHITGWHRRDLDRFQAALRHEPTPPPPWPAHMETDDEINAWFVAADRDRSVAEVLGNARDLFQQALATFDAFPEAELLDPVRFPWLEEPLSGAAYFAHYHDEHEADLRAWLAKVQRGEV